MSFIDDPTLPFPKFDLNPFAGDPSKAISAGDWNTVCQSLLDLRDAVSGLTGSGPSSPLLFLIRSDSEGVTLTTETDMDDPVDNVTVPNGNVVLTKMYSLNFVEPISPGILGTGPLRIIGFSPAHGPELAIGKALNDLLNGPGSTPTTTSKVWLDQISLSSSKISDWVPSSTSGQLSPLLGGSNLYGNSKNRANAASAISNRSIPCMFVLLGSNDGSDPTSAANAGTNATAFISQHRADLGAGLLVVWAIPQSTLPLGVFPNIATARANLITALTGTPGLAMVFTEDMPVNDDGAHFTASAISVIGTRQAAAYRRLAGIGPRAVAAPTVVGFSQATYNGSIHGLSGFSGAAGANLRAWPYQDSVDGDVMFLPVFSGSIGAGSPIATPTGWTLQGSQISSLDGAGVGNRVALFTRSCLQADLDGNAQSTGGPGAPVTATVTPGGAQFVVKPFTVRSSVRLPTLNAGPVAYTHTTLDTTAVAAPGVTTSKTGCTWFFLVTAWGNTNLSNGFTVTNPNVSGLTQVFGAAYPSSSGNFLFLGLWTGTLAAAGASGNTTVQPAAGSPSCSHQGYTWAM